MPRRRVEPSPDRLTAVLSPPPQVEQEPFDDEWQSLFPGPARPEPAPPATPAPERVGRVFTVPRALAGAVTRPAWLALVGVAVVCVVVAAVVGVRTARAVAVAAPTVVGPVSSGSGSLTPDGLLRRPGGLASASTTSAAPGVATGATASGGTSATVVVHVVGLVARPGVVRLPSGSRVIDALTASGGTRRGADVAQVNLARPLTDGEKIVLPAVGAPPPAAALSPPGGPDAGGQSGSSPGRSGTPGSGGAAGGQGDAGGSGARGGPSGSGVVNLNTADVAALESLPGVGPVLAGRIVQWRVEHGRFTSVDELVEVPGIGEKLLERIRSVARV